MASPDREREIAKPYRQPLHHLRSDDIGAAPPPGRRTPFDNAGDLQPTTLLSSPPDTSNTTTRTDSPSAQTLIGEGSKQNNVTVFADVTNTIPDPRPDEDSVSRAQQPDSESDVNPSSSSRGSDQPPPPIPPRGRSDEAGSEGEEPILPTTASDVQWETWHKGQVITVDDSTRPNGEVIKIYREAPREDGIQYTPIIITTTSGTAVPISGLDIIQVYGKQDGKVTGERPIAIFQGDEGMPKGYTSSVVPDPEREQALEGIREFVESLKDEPDFPPAIGRENPRVPSLSFLSDVVTRPLRGPSSRLVDIPSGKPNEHLIYYPMFGSRITIITPSGFLIKGRTHDVIEVAHMGPDGGYETLKRFPLGKIPEEDNYIVLE